MQIKAHALIAPSLLKPFFWPFLASCTAKLSWHASPDSVETSYMVWLALIGNGYYKERCGRTYLERPFKGASLSAHGFIHQWRRTANDLFHYSAILRHIIHTESTNCKSAKSGIVNAVFTPSSFFFLRSFSPSCLSAEILARHQCLICNQISLLAKPSTTCFSAYWHN